MPFTAPPRSRRDALVDWAWESVPHHEEVVSGDALFLEDGRRDGRLLFLMIDVTGHGRRAAAVVDLFRTFYLRDEMSLEKSPYELMRVLDSFVAPHAAGDKDDRHGPRMSDRSRKAALGRYASGLAVLIDPSTGEVAIAGCGEQAPYLLAADGAIPIKLNIAGSWFGLTMWQENLPEDQSPELALTLGQGSRLFAFTDGVPEAQPHGSDETVLFRNTDLEPVLSGLPADGSPAVQIAQLLNKIQAYVDGPWPKDDTTVILWRADGETISEKISK